jgi:hypothetical protein
MVLIVLVALFRPYKRDFYNHLDVLILFNLGTLNALSIYIFVSNKFSHKVYVVQCILVWLPLVYMLCYAVWNRVRHRKWYEAVKDKLIRLVRFLKQEDGSDEECQPILGINPDVFSDVEESVDMSSSGDPDDSLFRRATRRNRYKSTNQNITQSSGSDSRAAAPVRPVSVSSMVVSMWKDESAVEKDLVKRDSGTGISTGGSSRSGLDSNDS